MSVPVCLPECARVCVRARVCECACLRGTCASVHARASGCARVLFADLL